MTPSEQSDIPAHIRHGRLWTYHHYGCRCEECVAAKAAYRKTRPQDELRVGRRAEQKRAWDRRRSNGGTRS